MFNHKCTMSKRFVVVALLAMVVIGGSRPSVAAPRQSFLKINQYYVLFTNPVIPFINQRGKFIVGLQGFSELIGGHVTSAKGSETVHFRNKTVKFVDYSRTIDIDGKVDQIADPPEERPALQSTTLSASGVFNKPPSKMLVPLSVLAHAFHFQLLWQPRTRTLLIQDKSLALPDVDSSLWAENIRRFEFPDLHPDPLVLVGAILRSGSMPTYNIPSSTAKSKNMKLLEFKVKNSSTQDFAEGQAHINFFSSGGVEHGAPMPSADIPDPAPLALKTGATRSEVTEVNGPNSHNVRYIVAWLVVKNLASQ